MTNAPTLREAARALVAKLNECEPHISALVERAGQYVGPHYGVELDALREALAAKVPEDELIERCARAICQSGKFETGEGTCSLRCMEFLGDPRKKGCPFAKAVHRDLSRAVLEAADRIEALGSPVRS